MSIRYLQSLGDGYSSEPLPRLPTNHPTEIFRTIARLSGFRTSVGFEMSSLGVETMGRSRGPGIYRGVYVAREYAEELPATLWPACRRGEWLQELVS